MMREKWKRAGKWLLRRKKWVGGAALLALVALIFTLVNHPAVVGVSATTRVLPIYCVQRDNKCVSLSFDAAWGNEDTQTLIDILGKYKVKATFFVVGDWVERYPESVRALAEAGHEVMNHSDDHAHFSRRTAQEIKDNVTACSDRLEAVTGVRPTLFRCPYGEYDDHVITALEGMGITAVQWDVDSLDWKDYDAKTIFARVKGRVQPGSIVLFHNAALHTPEALGDIVSWLLQEGYKIVPVSQLLLSGNTTIDHTGRQLPA
jgi:peptidoglycan/xylan/chitin deacetylase (PgdA/CDA1 family)